MLLTMWYGICDLVRNYLQNRSIITTSTNQEVGTDVERGCLPRSVLGPSLCNIMLDDLLQILEGQCEIISYADDCVLVIEVNSSNQ